ncbi:MAG: type II toxin-antitoxin system RelE/ParE family toxin, partial [Clostridiales bacterium]|nr:type II toxin-antitoxin system RelE/ParE family toxin [Clostridiales bacterium]
MKKLPAFFYRLDSGREPVREFLLDLGKTDSTIIGNDIKTVERGWPVGMPVCKPLVSGLWQVRSNLSDNRIARIIFCIHQGKMYLLHGFIKKTIETPKADMDLAKDRMRILKRG